MSLTAKRILLEERAHMLHGDRNLCLTEPYIYKTVYARYYTNSKIDQSQLIRSGQQVDLLKIKSIQSSGKDIGFYPCRTF